MTPYRRVVTTGFATGYVAACGMGNAAGRLSWATASDYLGRRNTYYVFGSAIPIVGSIPWLVSAAVEDPASLAPLYAFYGGSLLCITCGPLGSASHAGGANLRDDANTIARSHLMVHRRGVVWRDPR